MLGKFNCFRFVWVVGLFATLILMFLLVLKYKIYYENRLDYVYFYQCGEAVCSTNDRDDVKGEVYSAYYYQTEVPVIEKVLSSEYLVLTGQELYDYKTGIVIARGYSDYEIVMDYFRVMLDNKYGLIDEKGKLVISCNYDEVMTYDNENFVVLDNGSYYVLNNLEEKLFENGYDYIYAYMDTMVVVKDNKLDILDKEGKSLIKDKLDTYNSLDSKFIEIEVLDIELLIKIYKDNDYYFYSFDRDTKELKIIDS